MIIKGLSIKDVRPDEGGYGPDVRGWGGVFSKRTMSDRVGGGIKSVFARTSLMDDPKS